MSEDPTQPPTESEARGAELRENIALTDARRKEEEVARAQKEKEAAAKEEEKRSREAEELREKAERVGEEADAMRAQADEAGRARTSQDYTPPHPDGGKTSFPGSDKLPAAAQRPEVLVGAAFAGSFVLARILKRLFD